MGKKKRKTTLTYNYWGSDTKFSLPQNTLTHGHLGETFIFCVHETHNFKADWFKEGTKYNY